MRKGSTKLKALTGIFVLINLIWRIYKIFEQKWIFTINPKGHETQFFLLEITRDYQRLLKITRITGLPEITKITMRLLKITKITKDYQGLPGITKDYQGLPGD